MDLFLQQTLAGISNGAIYAALALALVMIFNTTGHINFAQGEMALLGTYIAWTLLAAGLPYWLAFVITVVAAFIFGVSVDRLVIRRFRNAPHLALVVVFVGLLLAFNAAAGWIWGFTIKDFPSPVSGLSTGTVLIGAHSLFAILVSLGLLSLLFLFFRFTLLGLAMRAAARNPASARLLGIRVERMLALGWGLASVLGTVAGLLIAPVTYLEPGMMMSVLLYAFASAMLGGMNSPGGAVLGGLLFGVLENLAGTYLIGNDLKLSFALAVVVTVLVIRPNGLFGRPDVKRV
ncbi:branched-chain amino acid ABC transporter permease [uncultured Tistrella sp.]|uniref:branched-chain amino acid ABC transporter permease n=1 Tax=Tistrella mobilis TaxID=171437 RepID=UPI000C0B7F99|nr:branched-chain amino acid ABC transporter permease [uncultured Tistrella sp.]MAM73844.1 branched-chain amino acid ABC transporter permease [Tistrella sp.]